MNIIWISSLISSPGGWVAHGGRRPMTAKQSALARSFVPTKPRLARTIVPYNVPMPRRATPNGARTRTAILETAADLASVDGLDGLTIGRLATELAMSKSGLFAHFGSKEELQLATIEEARQFLLDEDCHLRLGKGAANGAHRGQAHRQVTEPVDRLDENSLRSRGYSQLDCRWRDLTIGFRVGGWMHHAPYL